MASEKIEQYNLSVFRFYRLAHDLHMLANMSDTPWVWNIDWDSYLQFLLLLEPGGYFHNGSHLAAGLDGTPIPASSSPRCATTLAAWWHRIWVVSYSGAGYQRDRDRFSQSINYHYKQSGYLVNGFYAVQYIHSFLICSANGQESNHLVWCS